jgi:uncharacterized protein YutE (UPF0331/DUF86 family)
MTARKINGNVVTKRILWVKEMTAALKELPLDNKETFLKSKNNVAAAESYLRRALEALFDLGRHILTRKYALPVTEYKKIAGGLVNSHNNLSGLPAQAGASSMSLYLIELFF